MLDYGLFKSEMRRLTSRVERRLKMSDKKVKNTAIAMDKLSMFIARLSLIWLTFSDETAISYQNEQKYSTPGVRSRNNELCKLV